MKVPVSWLRDFVDLPTDVGEVATRLAACGFAVDGIDGDVIDFDVTANRPDCLSVYGLAREASVAFDRPLRPYRQAAALPTGQTSVKVSVGDAGCGRYALAVADVTVASSPTWLAARLQAAGVRPINNIVDVTNYVMLELGQPMHAFDAARLAGGEIRVRRARPNEPLTTLDGQTRTLDDTMLVIADREKAVAVAGVMGGASSEVSAATTKIAIESAWFLPASVRATGRKLGLKTEASARFERGADVDASVVAIERALALLVEIGAGRLAGPVTDVFPRSVAPRVLPLRRSRLSAVLGVSVPDRETERLLDRLGFARTSTNDGWSVTAPSFRIDVLREIDLVEEIGRHWGLDRVPATFPALTSIPRPSAPAVLRTRWLRRLLCGAGLQEAVTFTFMEAQAASAHVTAADMVVITNPLSEKFAVMRPSLAPGLLDSLTYNRNRQASDIQLFEIGSVFAKGAGERHTVGWVITGRRHTHWLGDGGEVTFADTKGIAELIADALGVPVEFALATDVPWLVRGQAATIHVGAQAAGWIGRLATAPAGDDAVFAGELDLDALGRATLPGPRAITPLPRFPTIVRDLSILVDERLPAANVRGTIRTSAPATLVHVREFDRYQGKGVPDGLVSLSLRLTFRHSDRTLTDVEVQQAIDAIVQALAREHHATLRGK